MRRRGRERRVSVRMIWLAAATATAVSAIVGIAMALRHGARSHTEASPPAAVAEPPAPPVPLVQIRGGQTRPPEWLLAERDPPFDLAAFFDPIPLHLDATPLYLEALTEFDPELATGFPVERQSAARDAAAARWAEFERVFDTTSRRLVAGADPAVVVRALSAYEAGLAKLSRAQERPRCAFPFVTSLSHDLIPHGTAARRVAAVLALQIGVDLGRGELARPIRSLETLLRFSRDVQSRGYLISQLVAIAVQAIAKDLALDILRAPGLTAADTERLIVVLARHEREFPPHPHADGLRVEYVLNRVVLRDLERRTGDYTPDGLKALGRVYGVECTTVGDYLAAARKFAAQMGGAEGIEMTAAQYDARLAAMTSADYRREERAYVQYFREAIAAAERPYPRRSESAGRLAAARQASFFLSEWSDLPQLPPAFPRARAAIRGALCLAAVRRWQLATGGVPPDLGTALAAVGAGRVPSDPFADGPMRMAVVGGEPVVYSVGADGRDDGGLTDWANGQRPGDFLFRMRDK